MESSRHPAISGMGRLIAQCKIVIGGRAVAQPGGKRAVRFDAAPSHHIAFGCHDFFTGLTAVLRTGSLRLGASGGNLFDSGFFVVGGVHTTGWRGVMRAMFVRAGGKREQD